MNAINIYVDTSGSMSEIGKGSATKYVSKSIQDYCNFRSIETAFYYLNGTQIFHLERLEYSNDFEDNLNAEVRNSILISDGLLNILNDTFFDVSIAIGVDADHIKLNKISKKTFLNDNIVKALEFLIFKYSLLKREQNTEDEW